MRTYRAAGLLLSSEIELPGLIPAGAQGLPVDVTVRLGPVPASLDGDQPVGPTCRIAGDRFLLRVPGVARFLITAGRDIQIEPEGDTPSHEIAIFVTGTVIGILLHMRGQIVLHASAVLIGDRAVLFCGASGAGKSTLAAAINKRGYPIISDDVCAIGFAEGGRPHVLPDGRNHKLWADAVEHLGMQPGDPVRAQLKKYYVEASSTINETVAVGAIYELFETRPPRETGIGTPDVANTALMIRRNAYRPFLVRRMKQQAHYFEAASRLASAVGIYSLTRPLDFKQLDTVINGLEQHWAKCGLIPEAV